MSAVSDLALGCGYLEGNDRPQCGNCGGRNVVSSYCKLHQITIRPQGWCPTWMPTLAWGQQNRDAMAYMGLSMGASIRSIEHGLPERDA